MTAWRHGLAALSTWLAHFVICYALILIFPEVSYVGWAIIVLGIGGIAILILLLHRAGTSSLNWAITLVAGIGIAWQSLVGSI